MADPRALADEIDEHIRKLDAYQWEGAPDIDPMPILRKCSDYFRAPLPADVGEMVERLRKRYAGAEHGDKICLEAADLIAALSLRVKELERDRDESCDALGREIDALRADVIAADNQVAVARKMGIEECARWHDRLADVPDDENAKECLAHRECAAALRSLSPTLDLSPLVERAEAAALDAYVDGETASYNSRRIARAVLSELLPDVEGVK